MTLVCVNISASISLEPFLNQLDMLDIPHTSSPNSFAELLDYKPHTFYLNVTKFDSNSVKSKILISSLYVS